MAAIFKGVKAVFAGAVADDVKATFESHGGIVPHSMIYLTVLFDLFYFFVVSC